MKKSNSDVFEIYRDEDLVLPDLIGLGWCSTDYPRLGGPRTDGRIAYEIGYVARGSIEWLTEDGLDEAGPGNLIVEWPGDWQGGENAIVHPCERFWVRFDFPPVRALPGLPTKTVESLKRAFLSMKARHFPASPQVRGYFEQMLAQQRDPRDFAEDISRAAFHQILLHTVNDHTREQSVTWSDHVRRAVAYVDAHLAEDFPVEAVAREVGLSVGYFYELFVHEVGLTPGQYHMRGRIGAAKHRLIHSDLSVTALSMELGFSSSQYFATVFKKIVGLTPGAYRRLREPPTGAGRGRGRPIEAGTRALPRAAVEA